MFSKHGPHMKVSVLIKYHNVIWLLGSLQLWLGHHSIRETKPVLVQEVKCLSIKDGIKVASLEAKDPKFLERL